MDDDLKKLALDTPLKVTKHMSDLRVADALTDIFALFKRCNKYIDETMPWALAKEPDKQARLETVLYNLVESITIGAVLLKSFMPETAEKILTQLNSADRECDQLGVFGAYPNNNKVTENPEILFVRQDVNEVLEGLEQRKEEEKLSQYGPGIDVEPKEEIDIDFFDKVQLQIGQIIACEEVKKSKKLLCSQVKIGSQVRQIVSGIKSQYTPEEMVGKKVVVVTNLKPAVLAGVTSEGMLLCAEDENGNFCLLTAEKDMPHGAEIH